MIPPTNVQDVVMVMVAVEVAIIVVEVMDMDLLCPLLGQMQMTEENDASNSAVNKCPHNSNNDVADYLHVKI